MQRGQLLRALDLQQRCVDAGPEQLNMEVAPKRLQLLHELIRTATDFAHLVNPTNPIVAESSARDLQAAAGALGLKLRVL